MKKLEIIKQNNYEYCFKDENSNEFNLNLEFLDIEQKPKIGDYIYMHEELLDSQYDGYCSSYTFGSVDSKYGKQNIALDDVDVIKLVIDKKGIILKRLYG